MPTSSLSATRHTRPTSREKKYPARPTSVLFASLMTSSSVSNLMRAARGPKVSSSLMSASKGTSLRTVGMKKEVFGIDFPPTRTCAPLETASATCLSTFSTARSWMSGPWVIPSSRPFPTLNVATLAARRDANSAYMADWTKILLAQTHV